MSPLSIGLALTMARAGANGETAAEMDRVLHIADPVVIHDSMNTLEQALATRALQPSGQDDRVIELATANRAFTQSGYQFKKPFLETLASRYGSVIGPLDFNKDTEGSRRKINAWVSDRTKAHIPELIGPDILTTDTRLALVNALYLKAHWAMPFWVDATEMKPFTTPTGSVQVATMHNAHQGQIGTGDGWRAVAMPYVGGQLSMTIVLPDTGKFDEVASHMDDAFVRSLDTAMSGPVADLWLPKFDISASVELSDQLKDMGMNLAFSYNADFSGMTDAEGLLLQAVVHQATVTIDEKGTVATASTVDIVIPASMPPPTAPFVVDRPFLFFVSDASTHAVLFVGQVTDPTKK